MRILSGVLVVLALTLAGITFAGSPVGSGRILMSDGVIAGGVNAQRHLRICDNFAGVWKITVLKRSGAISGTYTGPEGITGEVTGQQNGKSWDLTAKGAGIYGCWNRVHATATKPRKSRAGVGTIGFFDGPEGCDDYCCPSMSWSRCKQE